MSNGIKLCGMYIKDPSYRFNKQGIILKNAWLLGPSDPVLKFGKVEKYKEDAPEESDSADKDNNQDGEQQDSEPQKDKKANDNSQSDKESSGESQHSQDNKSGNESFNYSICEAYASIKHIYEDDTVNYGSNALIAGSNDVVKSNQPSNKQPKKKMTATRRKVFKTHNKQQSKDVDTKLVSDRGGFEDGGILSFKVDLPKEGYTLWKIQLDKNVKDVPSVVSAILSKRFKAAHAIASKDLGHDGLVPLSAETYMYKDNDVDYIPPFIGHANYGFDSGNDDGSSYYRGGSSDDPHVTISLAIAPINARTNKTEQKMLIEYVYNVLGDITGGALGKLGELAGDITKKVSDKITGGGDRYSYRDNDKGGDNESITDQLSKFLHKKFKFQGTHKNYNNYLSIKKFIDKQVKAKNLALYKEASTDLKKTFLANASFQNSQTMLMFY